MKHTFTYKLHIRVTHRCYDTKIEHTHVLLILIITAKNITRPKPWGSLQISAKLDVVTGNAISFVKKLLTGLYMGESSCNRQYRRPALGSLKRKLYLFCPIFQYAVRCNLSFHEIEILAWKSKTRENKIVHCSVLIFSTNSFRLRYSKLWIRKKMFLLIHDISGGTMIIKCKCL